MQNLRFALRSLRRSPAYTVTAALTLVIGIGASLTIFAIVNYGVKGWDPVTFAGVTVLLATVAVAATLVPARRAMRVAPAIALNQR